MLGEQGQLAESEGERAAAQAQAEAARGRADRVAADAALMEVFRVYGVGGRVCGLGFRV